MEINLHNIVFEQQDDFPKSDVVLPKDIDVEREYIMRQFLQSGYFFDETLYIDKFLREDKSIDIEKLELAISLAVEYLEFSSKFKNPIYVKLEGMGRYIQSRGIEGNPKKIYEESGFISGFCQAVADEESKHKKFIILYIG